MEDKKTLLDNLIFIGFADNKVPEVKEVSSKDWLYFGDDNLFPLKLLYLYDKSSNHGAIVNGKATYIIGKGFTQNPIINLNSLETRNRMFKKAVHDIEMFGGMALQAVWRKDGKINWTHVPFQYVRKSKDRPGYYYCKNWDWKKGKKVEPTYMEPFNPIKKTGAQLFFYKEYRPGVDVYPLPGYFAACNDIETDVEISIYNLSVTKNGQFSGKLVTFFNGEPTAEEKRKLEKQWNEKFNGSGNAGKTMLAFQTGSSTAPDVQDMSATDLDKLFDQMSKTTQAKIFSGHQITSPTLFGISEPGKLGGRNELQDAYEIFKNTYIAGKQETIEEIADYLAPYMGATAGDKINPVEPIGIKLDPVDFKEMLPKEWVYEQLGIDPEDYAESMIPSPSGVTGNAMVNEHLKNLTGRQQQNIDRITRKYKQGKISRQMAQVMLKGGLGLDDTQIEAFLNFSLVEEEDKVADMFEEIGVSKEQFTIVKSKPFKFETEVAEIFKDIKGNDSSILNLIRKDKRITPEVIAKTINESVEYVNARIGVLTESGVLTSNTETIGQDTIPERTVNPDAIDNQTPPETADILVRYSYEPKPGLDPVIKTTRAFCKKLIQLDRLYSRAEIESISQRVGYSVFDRKGGFWGTKDECRHRWVSHVVIKKRSK